MTVPAQEDPAAQVEQQVTELSEMKAITSMTQSTKVAVVTAKRQRTLADFVVTKSEPPNKKVRTDPLEPTLSQESTQSAISSTSSARSKPWAYGKTALNSIPFSLSAFQASLSEEENDLLKLEGQTLRPSWLKLLTEELKKPYFLQLKRMLKSEGVFDAEHHSTTVFPPAKDIYAWTASPLGRVRVVIIGQDPYHNVGQAHGFCFSVPQGVQVPPSLRNIYAELQAEYPDFKPPKHGNLTSWAHEGVLLLNTCLTVRAHQANSHSGKGWEQFTEKIIDIVCTYGGANLNKTGVGQGIVFMAWGAPAAKRVAKIDKKKHLVLTSPHPSPLSAHRGFIGNGHFKKANEWLEQKYGPLAVINWTRLDAK